MEQDINSKILETFDIEQKDLREYSPLTLAFIGDGVYEVVIRSIVVGEGNATPSKLHRYSAHYVKAASQVKMYKAVEDILTEEEEEALRKTEIFVSRVGFYRLICAPIFIMWFLILLALTSPD